ncbi:MAG: hypothetical protein KAR83_10295 [Thermodesulfovibrionales bacterium]|nr:hypothetical protein [Thermodesulfovibrionales bacterium]
MASFATNKDLIWATFNKLVRDVAGFQDNDNAFALGVVEMDHVVLKEGNTLKTVWNCTNSPGEGGLTFHASRATSIKDTYEDCLATLLDDKNITKSKHTYDRIDKKYNESSAIDPTDYKKLLGIADDDPDEYADTATGWRANPTKEGNRGNIRVDDAEGKVICASANGHFGGKLDAKAVGVGAQISGSVDYAEIGEAGEPGKNFWMQIEYGKSQNIADISRPWFDYSLLELGLKNATKDTQNSLRGFWADGSVNESGEVIKQPGVFRYIPSGIVLWEGIQVKLGFVSGEGTDLEVEGDIEGDLNILGINLGMKVKASGHVSYTEGSAVFTYKFDSGEFTTEPFILGIEYTKNVSPI